MLSYSCLLYLAPRDVFLPELRFACLPDSVPQGYFQPEPVTFSCSLCNPLLSPVPRTRPMMFPSFPSFLPHSKQSKQKLMLPPKAPPARPRARHNFDVICG